MARLIDADVLKDILEDVQYDDMTMQCPGTITAVKVFNTIDAQTTIDTAKSGKWIELHLDWAWQYRTYECSECGAQVKDTTNYCPHCGSRNLNC